MTADKVLDRPDDLCLRGTEIYDRDIRPSLGPEDEDKFVAIDVDSGDYEINGDDFVATERLLTRIPRALIWLARVGHRAAYRIGGRFAPKGLE
jgi:hypothetical protein